MQEEACVPGTPCLTLRWNTARPVTLREHGGASVLVGNNVERIRKEYEATLKLTRTPPTPRTLGWSYSNVLHRSHHQRPTPFTLLNPHCGNISQGESDASESSACPFGDE